MARFRVWAPNAQSVEVHIGRREEAHPRTPMQQEERGWWSVEVPTAGAGTDYFFVIDGHEPLPDPRSPSQPEGPFGPSRLLDQSTFPWTDQGFQAPPLAAGVIYELHIGTFTPEGTFDAAIGRLDYLRELGVTHVEIMPVAEFAGTRNWGYDGVDLYAPESAYGGPDGLKRLVDAAHARGLAILLDVVYNHFGPAGNFTAQYGPYVTDHYSTPWGDAVNLDDRGSDEVRRFFIDNALMWLRDYHIDGLRLDAVHAYFDQSAQHFLAQLSREVDALEATAGRHLVLIAETDLNNPRFIRSREAGGYGIDAQWVDEFHHAIHAALTGERDGFYMDFGSLADVAHTLQHGYVYDGRYSPYRDRTFGQPTTGLPANRFVAFLENHDLVGNRAEGDRLASLLPVERFKAALAILLTAPFVPMLFQGEEWGSTTPFQYFTDHDAELGRLVSEGRRREFAAFGWSEVPDPQDRATFERSKLDWDEHEREPYADILRWTRQLIALRTEHPILHDGDLAQVHVDYDEERRWLVMEHGPIRVAFNLGDSPQQVPLAGSTERTLLLASNSGVELVHDAVSLPANGVAVVSRT